MPIAFADIAFTETVRAEQARHGSAETYARFLSPDRSGGNELSVREVEFLALRDGFFQATVSETGWPYVQFRGGAPGFLRAVDQRTVCYADYRGNRQYISTGNLRHSDRVSIIALDYAHQRRLKLWGHARIVEDRDIIDLVSSEGAPPAERAIVIRIAAFDWNCPRHIPIRRTDTEAGGEIAHLAARIRDLEARLADAEASAP